VRLCRREDHVARADQLDLSLIGAFAGWRPERTNQDQSNTFRVVGIRFDVDNVSVENDDLARIELDRSPGSPEHQAIGLLLFSHAGNLHRVEGLDPFAGPSWVLAQDFADAVVHR
jgi:hypothetical protein